MACAFRFFAMEHRLQHGDFLENFCKLNYWHTRVALSERVFKKEMSYLSAIYVHKLAKSKSKHKMIQAETV